VDTFFVNWPHRRIWLWIFVVLLVYECYTLLPGQRDTLSDTVREVLRYTNWRFFFLPFWAWLTWHWIILGPKEPIFPTWRDLIPVGIGLLWAAVEVWVFKYGVTPH
jgi:hypothetical protein